MSAICFATGFLIYRWTLPNSERPVIFYFITGLIAVTVITEIAALLMPVNAWYLLCFLFGLLVFLFLNKNSFLHSLQRVKIRYKSISLLERISYVVAGLLFAYLAAGPIIMDDTESYHIQMVKWINEYGTVPGIANLHERFGFNSAWFSAVGLANVFADFQLYAVMNATISFWFCVYMLRKIGSTDKNQAIAAAILLLIALVFWPFLRGNAVNANYDFITTLIITVLVIEVHQEKGDPGLIPEFIIWPAFLITVRLMNFPFLLLFLLGVVVAYRKKGNYLLALIIPAIIVIPFLIRNVMLTGYLFFPSVAFDLLNVDWKTDSVMMQELIDYIKYYNRVSTEFMDISQTRLLNNWIPVWFQHLYTHDKIIVVTGSAGLIASIVDVIRSSRPKIFRFTIVTMLIMLVVWFLVAPDPRFIYGCLFAGSYLLFYKVSSLINVRIPALSAIVHIPFILAVSGYVLFRTVSQDMSVGLVETQPLPQPPVTEHRVDSVSVFIPSAINGNWNARCYATALPCAYKIDPRLEARGDRVRQGFRLKK